MDEPNIFESHYLQYWEYVKDHVDEDGWVYGNDIPYLLDAYFEANTDQPIDFEKSYEGKWRGPRWRPKSISLKIKDEH